MIGTSILVQLRLFLTSAAHCSCITVKGFTPAPVFTVNKSWLSQKQN